MKCGGKYWWGAYVGTPLPPVIRLIEKFFWKPWKDMITSKIVGWQCYSHSKPFSCVKHSHSQVHMKLYNTFQNADMKKGWLFWQPQYLIALTWACHSLWCNPLKRQRQRLLTPVAVHNAMFRWFLQKCRNITRVCSAACVCNFDFCTL